MKRVFFAISLVCFFALQANAAEPTVDWVKDYGSSGVFGQTIVRDNKYNYILYTTSSYNNHIETGDDLKIVKISNTGNVILEKSVGDISSMPNSVSNEMGTNIIQDFDSNYVFVSYGEIINYTPNTVTKNQIMINKLDENGNLLLTKRFESSDRKAYLYSLTTSFDNGYILIGESKSKNTLKNGALIIKLDKDFNVQFENIVSGAGNLFSSIVKTSDGNYVISGIANYPKGAGNSDFLVTKINKNADILWEKTFGTEGFEEAYKIIQTLDQGYAVVGMRASSSDGIVRNWLVKLDSNGLLQWDKAFSKADDFGRSLVQTQNGEYIVVSESLFSPIWKLSKTGDVLWNKSINDKFSGFHVVAVNCNEYIVAGYGNNGLNLSAVYITDSDSCCSNSVDTNGSTQEGINLVKANPSNYGLFTQAQIEAAKQTGIELVKAKPADYSLFTQAQIEAAKQTGIDLVKAKPADYSLFTQAQIEAAKQTGIELVKTKPADYSLFTQAQIEAAKQAAVNQCQTNPASCNIVVSQDQCKADPASCGLFTQTQVDTAKQDGVKQCQADPASCNIVVSQDQCKTNPASCGLFTQAQVDAAKQNSIETCKNDPQCKGIHAAYDAVKGEVHIPFVDVPNGLGFVQTFDVYLLQRAGSFIFDLDLNRVVLVP